LDQQLVVVPVVVEALLGVLFEEAGEHQEAEVPPVAGSEVAEVEVVGFQEGG
jgi:hypothetical protein